MTPGRLLLLDFSVIAPGGSSAYASGFLNALPDVWRERPGDGIELNVALPRGPMFSEEERRLRTVGVIVHRLATSRPGSWTGRLLPHATLPWLAFRLRATAVFVPRDVAPVLIRGRLTILAHNVLVWTKPTTMSDGWALRFRRVAGRVTVRRSSCVLAATAAIGRLIPAGSRPAYQVVFHGCDLPPIHLEEKDSALRDGAALRVIGLGTITPHKRFDVLIETVATLRDQRVAAELEIWGPVASDAEASRLRGLGRTRLGYDPLRGPVEPPRRTELFRSADVLMMGSSTESFGFPMVEAMRTSTVVVAPRCELVDEICADNGVTYDEGSWQSAADAIIVARPQFGSLADAGLRRSEELFSWRHCVETTLQAILDTGSEKDRRSERTGVRQGSGTRRCC